MLCPERQERPHREGVGRNGKGIQLHRRRTGHSLMDKPKKQQRKGVEHETNNKAESPTMRQVGFQH